MLRVKVSTLNEPRIRWESVGYLVKSTRADRFALARRSVTGAIGDAGELAVRESLALIFQGCLVVAQPKWYRMRVRASSCLLRQVSSHFKIIVLVYGQT